MRSRIQVPTTWTPHGVDEMTTITTPPTFQEQHNAAMRSIVFSLAVQLHERGTLPLQSLVGALESRQAFGTAAFREQENPVLQDLIEALKRIESALPPQH